MRLPDDLPILIKRHTDRPIRVQLYHWFREAILSGRLRPGARLPATRHLARTLRIARQTIVDAYDQLTAEGYISGRRGSGTCVCAVSDDLLRAYRQASRPRSRRGRNLSHRGTILAGVPALPAWLRGWTPRPFRIGVPALDAFPFDVWRRLAARRSRRPPRDLTAYGEPAGYPPLRKAIAAYVAATRAAHCTPEQVLIVEGSQQALDLAARVLLDPKDAVWFEEPGYWGARRAFHAAQARLVPVPVDDGGLNVDAGIARCRAARLAYVTPSHQYPLGATMSLERRLALLNWARRADAWIFEDDYDSEYRYTGPPITALQGLDDEGRVVYVGTFSKVLFPALRLGYMIVPEDVVDAFVTARALAGQHSPSLAQAVLTDFIEEGHFARHVRRMRKLYAERQEILRTTVAAVLGSALEVPPSDTGMHVIGWLPPGIGDRALSQRAAAEGVHAAPLSAFYLESCPRGGLLLGYAGYTPREITEGVRRLARLFDG